MDEKEDGFSLAQLFFIFARIGSLAWGGGGSTLAMMREEFCARRDTATTGITEEEFQILFALSRLVPGMNLLSLTVLLGFRWRGLAGSLVSLTGLTLPSFSLIVALCGLFRSSRDPAHAIPALAGAVHALAPAVAALLVHTL